MKSEYVGLKRFMITNISKGTITLPVPYSVCGKTVWGSVQIESNRAFDVLASKCQVDHSTLVRSPVFKRYLAHNRITCVQEADIVATPEPVYELPAEPAAEEPAAPVEAPPEPVSTPEEPVEMQPGAKPEPRAKTTKSSSKSKSTSK